MNEDRSILTAIENLPARKDFPQVMTVERTEGSKYQFYLLARAARKKLGIKRPTYFTMEKTGSGSTAPRVKAFLEEHGLSALKDLESPDQLFVLEGFTGSWVKSLSLPKGTYVVAETDGGLLEAEPYSRYYMKRRNILKVLLGLLEPWECTAPTAETEIHDTGKLSDRKLVKWERRKIQLSKLLNKEMAWSGLDSFEEFEPVLLKAKAMGWREKRIGKELSKFERGHTLMTLKRSDLPPLLDLLDRRGELITYSTLIRDLNDTAHFKQLRIMGIEEGRIQNEMDIPPWRVEELADATKMLTFDELKTESDQVIGYDLVVTKLGPLGVQLLLLNSSLRVKK